MAESFSRSAGGPPQPENMGANSWIGGLVFRVEKRTPFPRADPVFGFGKRTSFFVAFLSIPVAGQENGHLSGARKRSHWVRKTDPVLVSENGPDFRVGYHRFCAQFSGGQVRHGRARRRVHGGKDRWRCWKAGGGRNGRRVAVGKREMGGGGVPWNRRV